MSRQSKRARIRMAHVKHATWDKDRHMAIPTQTRGPKRTTPTHGKKNRWPYSAEARAQIMARGGKA